MRQPPNRFLLFTTALALLAGCGTGGAPSAASTAVSASPPLAGESTPSVLRPASRPRPVLTTEELIKLKAFEVKASAFSDFGMSVKTNFEVSWGGDVEWMLVTAVDPGSSAARMNLGPGDRILAIDGRQITELNRDAMLERLFQRKKGDTSRVLVLGRRDALPRFVVLIAARIGG